MQKPKAMLPPRPFFSRHRPRQAPGNSSVMIPMRGTARQTTKQATISTAKAAPTTSASCGQRNRAARAIPPRVVQTRAKPRRAVWSGLTDQNIEAAATTSRAIRNGWRMTTRKGRAGPQGDQGEAGGVGGQIADPQDGEPASVAFSPTSGSSQPPL
jgi:hypothetical protein